MKELIDKLYNDKILTRDEFAYILKNASEGASEEDCEYLFEQARKVSHKYFGNKIYIRGLIEVSNYCKNDCYYCGIRRSNKNAHRYRLTKEEILSCAHEGYKLGFRTFVMQGGEDDSFSDDKLVDIIKEIKSNYDCAITLSLGERSYESYERLFNAGADRYLLRHETIINEHYGKLHPEGMSLENRVACLHNLKKIGFQVGTGFMINSPYQTMDNIVEDLLFIKEFSPQMVGIGPFIPHKDTMFASESAGQLRLSLVLISIIRIMLQNALIPATTALGTIAPKGREKGILAGANVVMPNLSPIQNRKKYMLYDNKLSTGEEAAEGLLKLRESFKAIGYEVVEDIGNYAPIDKE